MQPPTRPPLPDQSPDADLVVGVDAGGTSTRAALADSSGALLRTGRAGPGNALSVPVAELTRTLVRALADAVPAELRHRVRCVVAGFAGAGAEPPPWPSGLEPPPLGRPKAETALAAALDTLGAAPARVQVRGDAEIAFASAPGTPESGLLLIAGTGAVAVRITGRRPAASVDGHGWLLGDQGSGFWIGRRGVQAVLGALDGCGPWTALVPAVTGLLLGRSVHRPPADPRQARALASLLVAAAQARPPVSLGQVCPLVTVAAAEGDGVAAAVLDSAADRLVGTLRALAPRTGETLVTSGGLAGPGGPLLGRIGERTVELGLRPQPVSDGLPGACALAAAALPTR